MTGPVCYFGAFGAPGVAHRALCGAVTLLSQAPVKWACGRVWRGEEDLQHPGCSPCPVVEGWVGEKPATVQEEYSWCWRPPSPRQTQPQAPFVGPKPDVGAGWNDLPTFLCLAWVDWQFKVVRNGPGGF